MISNETYQNPQAVMLNARAFGARWQKRAERERALERLTPSAERERQVIVYIFLNVRNTVKMFFHYKKLIFIKYNFFHKNFIYSY
jgi:glutamine synthetase type III